jgi:hypothetical protein
MFQLDTPPGQFGSYPAKLPFEHAFRTATVGTEAALVIVLVPDEVDNDDCEDTMELMIVLLPDEADEDDCEVPMELVLVTDVVKVLEIPKEKDVCVDDDLGPVADRLEETLLRRLEVFNVADTEEHGFLAEEDVCAVTMQVHAVRISCTDVGGWLSCDHCFRMLLQKPVGSAYFRISFT